MNRSLSGSSGRRGSKRISAKKSAATRSAAEQQLVGWPLPASDVDRTDSMRRRVAAFFSAGSSEARSRLIGLPIVDQPLVSGESIQRRANTLRRRRIGVREQD